MVKTVGYGFVRDEYGSAGLGPCANYITFQSEDKASVNQKREVVMSQCALSASPLQEPIVACRLGFLYNKEAVLGHLLNKTMPAPFAHIRALKDVKVLQVTRSEKDGPLLCAVTQADHSSQKALVNWASGKMLSQRAVDNLGKESCADDNGAFEPVGLAPDVADLKERRAALEAQAPKKKKRALEQKEEKTEEKTTAKVEGGPANFTKKMKHKSTSDIDERIKGYSESDVYKRLFKKDGEKDSTDAFGHAYSNKGIGV
jgi:hypothetical protein